MPARLFPCQGIEQGVYSGYQTIFTKGDKMPIAKCTITKDGIYALKTQGKVYELALHAYKVMHTLKDNHESRKILDKGKWAPASFWVTLRQNEDDFKNGGYTIRLQREAKPELERRYDDVYGSRAKARIRKRHLQSYFCGNVDKYYVKVNLKPREKIIYNHNHVWAKSTELVSADIEKYDKLKLTIDIIKAVKDCPDLTVTEKTRRLYRGLLKKNKKVK